MTKIKIIKCDNCGITHDFLNATGYEDIAKWIEIGEKNFCSTECYVNYLTEKQGE